MAECKCDPQARRVVATVTTVSLLTTLLTGIGLVFDTFSYYLACITLQEKDRMHRSNEFMLIPPLGSFLIGLVSWSLFYTNIVFPDYFLQEQSRKKLITGGLIAINILPNTVLGIGVSELLYALDYGHRCHATWSEVGIAKGIYIVGFLMLLSCLAFCVDITNFHLPFFYFHQKLQEFFVEQFGIDGDEGIFHYFSRTLSNSVRNSSISGNRSSLYNVIINDDSNSNTNPDFINGILNDDVRKQLLDFHQKDPEIVTMTNPLNSY